MPAGGGAGGRAAGGAGGSAREASRLRGDIRFYNKLLNSSSFKGDPERVRFEIKQAKDRLAVIGGQKVASTPKKETTAQQMKRFGVKPDKPIDRIARRLGIFD